MNLAPIIMGSMNLAPIIMNLTPIMMNLEPKIEN